MPPVLIGTSGRPTAIGAGVSTRRCWRSASGWHTTRSVSRPTDDVARAVAFYSDVFGWKFASYGSGVPYFVHEPAPGDGGGIPAAITAREEIVKAPTPTIEVDDIDNALIQVVMKGGQQGRVQDITGIGRFAYAIDPKGNIIALPQRPT